MTEADESTETAVAERSPAPLRDPEPPADLGPVAREEWQAVCEVLAPAGVLTQLDRGVMIAYCVAFEQMETARKELDASGGLLVTINGVPTKNPYLDVWSRASARVESLAGKLLLTPHARKCYRPS